MAADIAEIYLGKKDPSLALSRSLRMTRRSPFYSIYERGDMSS